MKGNNTIEFNENSMREAVEFYLNTQVFQEECAIKVLDINATKINAVPQYLIKFELSNIGAESK